MRVRSLLKSCAQPVIFCNTGIAMAPNKENDEATRLKKRCNAVAAIKAKQEYIITASLPDQPRAPDPHAKMSKRQFEKAMMMWRSELRAKSREMSL